MLLHDLQPVPGSTKPKRRVARGIGSGLGKTAGRGHKGQKARNKVPARFEGGQTPLHRRLPMKRGFRNPNKIYYAVINVGRLAELFKDGGEITPEILLEKKILSDLLDGVKILGNGDINVKLNVTAHAFSKTAEEKIRAAGGEVTVR